MEKKSYEIKSIDKIASIYEGYSDSTINKVTYTFEAVACGVIATFMAGLPILLKTNPDMSYADQYKALMYGLIGPSLAYPAMVNRIIHAVKSSKIAKKLGDELNSCRRGITDQELADYLEQKYDALDRIKYPSVYAEKKRKK